MAEGNMIVQDPKYKVIFTEAEASWLMAMCQNAHSEPEPDWDRKIRNNIFTALKSMGLNSL